jgi:biotin operon repressor
MTSFLLRRGPRLGENKRMAKAKVVKAVKAVKKNGVTITA